MTGSAARAASSAPRGRNGLLRADSAFGRFAVLVRRIGKLLRIGVRVGRLVVIHERARGPFCLMLRGRGKPLHEKWCQSSCSASRRHPETMKMAALFRTILQVGGLFSAAIVVQEEASITTRKLCPD